MQAKARIFEYSTVEFNGDLSSVNTFEIHKWAKGTMKRGDLCRFGTSNYRNDGIVIYDGDHFLDLDDDFFCYGCIPSEFEVVREFPSNYWEGVLPYHDDAVRYRNITVNNLHVVCESLLAFEVDNIIVVVVLDSVDLTEGEEHSDRHGFEYLRLDTIKTKLENEMQRSILLCRHESFFEDDNELLNEINANGDKTVLYWQL